MGLSFASLQCSDARSTTTKTSSTTIMTRTSESPTFTGELDRGFLDGCARMTGVLTHARPVDVETITRKLGGYSKPTHHNVLDVVISHFHDIQTQAQKTNPERFSEWR